MSDIKVKQEILKLVKPLTSNQLKELHSISDSGMSNMYNVFARVNRHSQLILEDSEKTQQARATINDFVRIAYMQLRRNITAISNNQNLMENLIKTRIELRGHCSNAEEVKNQFLSFLKNPFFNPESNEFNKNGLTYEQLMKFAWKQYPCIQEIFGSYAPLYFQSGSREYSSFIHVRSDYLYKTNKKKGNTECRLYLNLKAENIGTFARLVMRFGKEKQMPLYFKFSELDLDARSDTFLFYCSYDEVKDVVELIEEIKMQNPKLFEGTENVPPHLGTIKGYIGFGEEPTEAKKNVSNYEDGASYTQVRADYFEIVGYIKNRKDLTEKEKEEKIKKLQVEYDVVDDENIFLNKSTIEELKKSNYIKDNELGN